jgi:phosphohistidine phosphatase
MPPDVTAWSPVYDDGPVARTSRLIVMRHAKAGELPGGPDFERALKARGRGDCAAAGEWLRGGGYQPDLVLCSAARRTRQTWQYVSGALGGSPAVVVEQALYSAGPLEVLDVIRAAEGQPGTVMYVGHNPAAAELVALVSGADLHFPTAAIAVIAVTGNWPELAPGAGELIASWTPAGGPGDPPSGAA